MASLILHLALQCNGWWTRYINSCPADGLGVDNKVPGGIPHPTVSIAKVSLSSKNSCGVGMVGIVGDVSAALESDYLDEYSYCDNLFGHLQMRLQDLLV